VWTGRGTRNDEGVKRKDGTEASATLKDVAAHAGVSFKTVSNVVNNHDAEVSEQTRARVRASIVALNYRPNVAARHLRTTRTGVLALVIPDLFNPYFAELSAAVITAATARSYTALIDYTRGQRAEELLVVGGLRPHMIDGVILNALELDADDVTPERVAVPIVLVGERLSGAPFDHVMMDNVAAARLATEHLLRLGRRRIAMIGASDDPRDEMPRLRLQGVRQALDAAGMGVDPQLVMTSPPASFGRVDGIEGMRRLLARGAVPDAVVGFNDLVALGAMKVLRDTGFRVPDDIAVVGFDDIEEGRYATPALTTISPDKAHIAHLAVALLLARIDGSRTVPPEQIDPGFQLLVRQSTTA